MGQVISFVGSTPPARFDGNAWTEVRVEEAASSAGPWATIDTLELDPVDADPAEPQTRNFTTENGSALDGLWYRVVFLDASGDPSQPSVPIQNAAVSNRDLCSVDDVVGYVPGYDQDDPENAATQVKLAALITAESRTIHQLTGRELKAIAGADPRVFELGAGACERRRVRIGDATSIDTVELLDVDGSSLGVVDESDYVLEPRIREEWEPIEAISFPRIPGTSSVRLAPRRLLQVSGVWGFPQVPPDVVEACAKRVILRYLNDAASRGTRFADALNESEINLGALLKSASEALAGYSSPPFA